MISDFRNLKMGVETSKPTVYFDGSCPLCRAEIGYYRRRDTADTLCFVDVSEPDAVLHDGLTQRQAMRRFHVRTGDGQLLSGAAAFVAMSEFPRGVGLGRNPKPNRRSTRRICGL